jgi:hypothetical protein
MEKQQPRRSFWRYLRSYDTFAQPISFMLDGGSDRFRSKVGAFGSLIMYIFILSYSGMKIADIAKGTNTVTIVKE